MQFFPFVAQQQVAQAEASFASARDDAYAQGDAFSQVFDQKVGEARAVYGEGNEQNAELMWHKAQAGVETMRGIRDEVISRGKTAAEGATNVATAIKGKAKSAAKFSEEGLSDAQAALRSAIARLQGKPYDKTALNSLGTMKMGREDVAALKESLKEFGMSDIEIDELIEKVSSESGFSWGEFIASMSDRINGGDAFPAKLSDSEKLELTSFFQKVGFTPQETKDLLDKLGAGKFTTVWNNISERLAKNPSNVTVNASELEALGKAMKLSPKATAQLKSLLGNQESLVLTPESLKSVMASLKGEVAADRKTATDADRKVMDAINKALNDAASRAENAELASSQEKGDARVQRLLSEQQDREEDAEKSSKQVRRTGEKSEHGEQAVVDAKTAAKNNAKTNADKDGKVAAAVGDVKTEAKSDPKAVDPKVKAEADREALSRTAQDTDSRSSRYGSDDKKGGEQQKGDTPEEFSGTTKGKDVWDTILDKVRVDRSFDNVVPGTAQAVNAARQSATEAVAAKFGDQAPARFMKQVEDGVLSNLGQGRRRLVMQIDPPELGKLNLVLQVKDNEVTAMFRAETQDAGRLLSEQFSQLRNQLEQQGLKVARMEVQTQLRDGSGQHNWQGAQQHNEARDQRESTQRSGLLRMMRGNTEELVQELQLDPATARIAREGLDIIA